MEHELQSIGLVTTVSFVMDGWMIASPSSPRYDLLDPRPKFVVLCSYLSQSVIQR